MRAAMPLPVDARRPTVGARRLTVGARRLTVGARRLTVGARRLTVGARRLTVGARRLTVGARPTEHAISLLARNHLPPTLQGLTLQVPRSAAVVLRVVCANGTFMTANTVRARRIPSPAT